MHTFTSAIHHCDGYEDTLGTTIVNQSFEAAYLPLRQFISSLPSSQKIFSTWPACLFRLFFLA
jgi:hypothetical protein